MLQLNDLGTRAKKTVTFDGGVLNAIGDINGTSNPHTLFTVTGEVMVKIFGHCTTLLADAGSTGTVEIGISGNTASLIAQTTAVDIDANEIWVDTAPATIEALPEYSIVVNGTDIELLCATEDITGGVIDFYCYWIPISTDGNVV
jgi:hypothetical protein